MRLADDLLPGAGAIAEYVYGQNTPELRRRIYYKYERRKDKDGWPVWKDGQEITSRKSLLDLHFTPKGKIQAA